MKWAGVWIDHASARIIELSDGKSTVVTRRSQVEPRHRSAGQWGAALPGRIGGSPLRHYQNRREEELKRFYNQVIGDLKNCDAILIMGPGEAKRELADRMKKRAGLKDRTVQVETASRMTDAQMMVRVQRFADAT